MNRPYLWGDASLLFKKSNIENEKRAKLEKKKKEDEIKLARINKRVFESRIASEGSDGAVQASKKPITNDIDSFSEIFYKGIKLDNNKTSTTGLAKRGSLEEKKNDQSREIFIFQPKNSLPQKEQAPDTVSNQNQGERNEPKNPVQLKNAIKGEQLRSCDIRPIFKSKFNKDKKDNEVQTGEKIGIQKGKEENIPKNKEKEIPDKTAIEQPEDHNQEQKPAAKKKGRSRKISDLKKKQKPATNNAEQKNISEEGKAEVSEEAPDDKMNLKKRKFKSNDNFVAINMKRRYKERFRGNIQKYRTRFTKNGKMKGNFNKITKGKAAEGQGNQAKQSKFEYFQEEDQKTELQILLLSKKGDIYFNCLSSGLKIDLSNYEEEEKDDEIKVLLKTICDKKEFSPEDFDFVTKKIFGYDSLFDFQRDAITKILNKKMSLFVSMPTGFGKSLVYQFSGLLLEGLTIVITPFISLMFDQISKLPRLLPGACLNSMLTIDKKQKILDLAKNNKIKILYMTPELFETDILELITAESFPKISLICIDEIHCISEFSHSYRIAYLKLVKSIKSKFYDSIIVGLTATANKKVSSDLCSTLGLSDVVGEKLRPQEKQKIRPVLINEQAKFAELKKTLENFPFCNFRSILIFVLYKYTAQRLYNELTNNGIRDCFYYNPDLEEGKRMEIHENFMRNKIRILIVTASFSMGLDKSDIQGVIHYNMPKSVESLIQEIGRAGRGERVEAESVVFFDQMDYFKLRGLIFTDSLRSQNINSILKATFEDPLDNSNEESQRTIETKSTIDPQNVSARKTNLKRASSRIEPEQRNKWDKLEALKFKNVEINKNRKVKMLEFKKLESALNIKKDTLVYLFMKLEDICGTEVFTFHQIPWETCSVKFYKTKSEDLKASSFLIKYGLENSRVMNGCYKINIIKLCLQQNISFHQVTRELKRLYFEHKVFYELEDECVCFEVKKQISNEDYLAVWMEMNKSFEKKDRSQAFKLDALYLILYKTIALNREYFKEIIQNYFEIQDEDLSKLFGDPHIERFFPFLSSQADSDAIKEDIRKFYKEYISRTKSFEDGELMSLLLPNNMVKLMQGINTHNINYKEWQRCWLWENYKEYKYEELFEIVKPILTDLSLELIN